MRDLSEIEKINHQEKLKDFVKELNEENVILIKYGLEICHVCYMIPIDKFFLYYDYPYKNGIVEDFNRDLNNSSLPIYEKSNKTLDLFRQENNNIAEKGYIYYKYQFDSQNNQYNLFDCKSNLGSENEKDILYDYLPIVHFASNLKNSYSTNVILTQENQTTEFEQLLTLYRPLKLVNDSITTTSLALSFKIKKGKPFNTNCLLGVENNVLKRIIRYFDSPVLDKVLSEQRKFEILGYHHSINGLYLTSTINLLKSYTQKFDLEKIKIKVNEIEKKNNFLGIIHDFIFQQEYLRAGYLLNETVNPLLGKSIYEILGYFNSEVNFTNVNINFLGDIKKIQFCPVTVDANGNFELSDLQLLLWNIWLNACKSAQKNKEKSIDIVIDNVEGKIGLIFKNAGKLPEKYIDFLINDFETYPFKDENKPIKGLEIIKSIFNRNNHKWLFDVKVTDTPSSITQFTLIFCKLNFEDEDINY